MHLVIWVLNLMCCKLRLDHCKVYVGWQGSALLSSIHLTFNLSTSCTFHLGSEILREEMKPYTGLRCFSLFGQIFYIEYEDEWPPPGCSRFLFLPRHKPNPLYYPWWQLQGTRHTCCHQHQLIIAQFSDSDTCAHKLKKMSRYCLPSWSHGTSTNGDLTKAQDPPGLKLAMSRISRD